MHGLAAAGDGLRVSGTEADETTTGGRCAVGWGSSFERTHPSAHTARTCIRVIAVHPLILRVLIRELFRILVP